MGKHKGEGGSTAQKSTTKLKKEKKKKKKKNERAISNKMCMDPLSKNPVEFFCSAGHKVGESKDKIETAVSLFKPGFLGSTDIQFYGTG